jgi:hypothetical protein
MSKIHIKSVVLGIGIGIIIASFISIIYLAGRSPENLSKEQVRELAIKYNLIEK